MTLAAATFAGCEGQKNANNPPQVALDIPRGYSDTLTLQRGGRFYTFGPFVGYYFRPMEANDLSRVRFVCFNEEQFYASDMPVNARLYEGDAVLTELPEVEGAIPDTGERIRPVFFDEAPQRWLDTRPQPREEYLHFHSLHDGSGASRLGYWIRHEAVATFTYDMGGRVDDTSPLHHQVAPGIDRDFARIIEFDFGD
jgi:hypothetical protein